MDILTHFMKIIDAPVWSRIINKKLKIITLKVKYLEEISKRHIQVQVRDNMHTKNHCPMYSKNGVTAR